MAEPLQASIYFTNPLYKSLLLKKVRMGLLLIFCIFFSLNPIFSATITSVSNGEWSSAGTWAGGINPEADDDVVINTEVTIATGTKAEVNSLNISSKGKLIVEGILIIRGNLTMDNNGSELITGSGASVFIFGNAILDNRVIINLSSYFIVLGNFTKSGANNQGNLTITDAIIYVFGKISSAWDNFTACESGKYAGTTSTANDECDAGGFEDFIENVSPEDLPENLYQLIIEEINGCTYPEITNPGNQSGCESYILPEISGSNLVAPKYFDNSQALGGNEITGHITSTQTVWIYDETASGCSDEVNFLVIIYPIPQTSEISTD